MHMGADMFWNDVKFQRHEFPILCTGLNWIDKKIGGGTVNLGNYLLPCWLVGHGLQAQYLPTNKHLTEILFRTLKT